MTSLPSTPKRKRNNAWTPCPKYQADSAEPPTTPPQPHSPRSQVASRLSNLRLDSTAQNEPPRPTPTESPTMLIKRIRFTSQPDHYPADNKNIQEASATTTASTTNPTMQSPNSDTTPFTSFTSSTYPPTPPQSTHPTSPLPASPPSYHLDLPSDDDGRGINGIGYRPTPAMAYLRAQKRKQQVLDWRAREAKDARQKRRERRVEWDKGRGVGLEERAREKEERVVRFKEGPGEVE